MGGVKVVNIYDRFGPESGVSTTAQDTVEDFGHPLGGYIVQF